jgi:pimeloyl-ACP methyl ester carboxylesterase
MFFMTYIYGSIFWICICCILCIFLVAISICSFATKILLPLPRYKSIAEQTTDIVSSYGFREEIVDVSGVPIHCVIKDNVTNDGFGTDDSELVGERANPPDCELDRASNDNDDVFVFVHGTASASIIFFEVMKCIPANIKCIAIDLPNFGISGSINTDKHDSNESVIRCYADIIGNTLIKLNILKNTILVAHSLGGFISIYTAERFPIKKLVLLNPAGILPTLGTYGYYWGMFFKAGLPTSMFHFPFISHQLLCYLSHIIFSNHSQNKIADFWLTFFMNERNTGHEILQRLITIRPFYSYWNTPAITTLLDVYKNVSTHICFGEDDTIIPSHIGAFLSEVTDGEIMIHNIKNASHNPCCNIECFLKYIDSVIKNEKKHQRRVHFTPTRFEKLKWRYRGYSYHCPKQTNESFQNVYNYLLAHNNL